MEGLVFAFKLGIYCLLVGWGLNILLNKNRGWGYYVLLILLPPIGLIVALCLKTVKKEVPHSNDFTNITPGNDVTNGEP